MKRTYVRYSCDRCQRRQEYDEGPPECHFGPEPTPLEAREEWANLYPKQVAMLGHGPYGFEPLTVCIDCLTPGELDQLTGQRAKWEEAGRDIPF